MRTLSLNLDLSDAEILRDAVEHQLRQSADRDELRLVDDRMQSLRATLHELTRMIDRPHPRRRIGLTTSPREDEVILRRIT